VLRTEPCAIDRNCSIQLQISCSAALILEARLANRLTNQQTSQPTNKPTNKQANNQTRIIQVRQHGKRKVLAILDVYGFENVSSNSFEQLTTNYCNEKLHQLITEVVLKEEQEEYILEGLEWNQITYMDNTIVCDLIEKSPHGIFAVLDEECQRPGVVTDDTFLLKLSQEFHDHAYFEALATWQQQDKRKTAEAVTINSFRSVPLDCQST